MLLSTGTMSSCQPCTMAVGQATSCGVYSSISRHVKSRRQQEQAARVKAARRGCGDMPAHAGPHQHQRSRESFPKTQELAHSVAGIVEAAIIHRFDRHVEVSDHSRHRRDLRAPWAALLAMRKHHRA